MSRTGALLINIGSPRSAAVRDVSLFLREFLMDKRVLDLPWPLRFLLVNFVILPMHARKAANAYRKIWTVEGPPLILASLKLKTALRARLKIPVELGMRYGMPSIGSAVSTLARAGVAKLVVVPLFPQYAMSSYESAVAHVKVVVGRHNPAMQLLVQPPFYAHPEYISALVEVARPYLQSGYDHLLLSFHSVPERHLRKTDPTGSHCLSRPDCCETTSRAHATCYRHQCFKTAAAFAAAAGLDPKRYWVTFQSRFGPGRWLGPDTVEQLRKLAMAGVKKIAVLCPSFVTDCLETLGEIGVAARAEFLATGGTDFALIPSLNDHPRWVAALEIMIDQTLRANSSA